VTVVNQPFVFGWHDGQLYLQAFDVLEDDPRDWKKAQQKLLSRSLARRIQAELKARGETVNWDAVSLLAHDPRGVPVPISLPGASIESVLAAAPRVRRRDGQHQPAGTALRQRPAGADESGCPRRPDPELIRMACASSATVAAAAIGRGGPSPS
jgi:hypothetical protein